MRERRKEGKENGRYITRGKEKTERAKSKIMKGRLKKVKKDEQTGKEKNKRNR